MLSNALKAKIHIAKAELGLSEDLYRDILAVQFGAKSCTDLSPRQADQLLEHFKTLGWKPRRKKRPRVRRSPAPLGLPTPEQLAFLEDLYSGLGWALHRRMGFNEKLCGKPWPQTRRAASRIIEALKRMKGRGYSERVNKRGCDEHTMGE
ncbi:MAG: DUF1018 domain-containing protein [Nitrospirae bacterium]|nr:DUF1018 domain-containing protein [Nitrospirota bacterium]